MMGRISWKKKKFYFVIDSSLYYRSVGGRCDLTGGGIKPTALRVVFKQLDWVLEHKNQSNKGFHYNSIFIVHLFKGFHYNEALL